MDFILCNGLGTLLQIVLKNYGAILKQLIIFVAGR